MPPGTFVLAVFGPDFVTREIEGVHVEPGKTVDVGTIEVERGRTIRGRVVDEAGHGVDGARVMVGKRGVESMLDQRWRDDWERRKLGDAGAITDGDGRFEIAGVPTSVVEIAAIHPAAGRSNPIEVPAAEVTIQLSPTGRLDGRVADVSAGALVTVRVRRTPKQWGTFASVGHDGRFAVDALVPGRYEVVLDYDTQREREIVQVEIRAGETTTIELTGGSARR